MNLALRPRLVGIVAGSLVALTMAGSAFAATPAPTTSVTLSGPCAIQREAVREHPNDVADLKALGDCEIARRFVTLDVLDTAISTSPYLTSAHRTTLDGMVSTTRHGLTSLRATIDADTTATGLHADLPRIATDYRVYLLLAPQVNLTRVADAQVAAVGRLDQLATRLQSWIDLAKSHGKDVSQAQADLDAMQGNAADAQAAASPVPGQILPLTPADWNSGTAGPILTSARHSLRSAHDDLAAARADAAACVAALKALV
jgi:hypothetical protein